MGAATSGNTASTASPIVIRTRIIFIFEPPWFFERFGMLRSFFYFLRPAGLAFAPLIFYFLRPAGLAFAAQVLKIAADDLVRRDSQRTSTSMIAEPLIHDTSARPPRASARTQMDAVENCMGSAPGSAFRDISSKCFFNRAKIPQLWASAHWSRVQF